MKLTKVSVNKLFGIFKHEIKLNNERGITIIIGENGLGKTAILEMMEAFFRWDFYHFKNIEFQDLIMEFDDGVVWTIDKVQNDNKEMYLQVNQKGIKKKYLIELFDYTSTRIRNEALHISRSRDNLKRVGPNRWIDAFTGKSYTALELIEHFGSDYQVYQVYNSYESLKDSGAPEWFITRIENTKVSLIETQRVFDFGYRERVPIETVKKYSKELTDLIKRNLTVYTELSSKLDRTYPNRLIEELKGRKSIISEDNLNKQLSDLEDKRNLLDKVGLVETEKDSNLLIDNQEDVVKDVLNLYIKDSFEKLSIFDEIAEKIELLLKIINERFKHKKLYINKTDGFVFKSTVIKVEENKFKVIPLEQLSSGEKNELILFYKLIFNSTPNSLILIDEPEISLHISWQNKFISDLKDIHKLNKLDILIATHSPDIISNNWDLRVELKGVE